MNILRIERKKYHSHREKARNDPEKYMAIIIDGMDQSKTNLPNTSHISKSLSSLWRLRTHITGTLIHTKTPHGKLKLAYAFIDLLQWPHGSNLTLTILLKSISDYQKSHPLSKTLYVQMDNTCRENKNRYVLCMCAVLVQMRIFEKVCLVRALAWLLLSFFFKFAGSTEFPTCGSYPRGHRPAVLKNIRGNQKKWM